MLPLDYLIDELRSVSKRTSNRWEQASFNEYQKVN